MSLSLKVSELLGLFPNANIDGALDLENISGIANLQNASIGDLSFWVIKIQKLCKEV